MIVGKLETQTRVLTYIPGRFAGNDPAPGSGQEILNISRIGLGRVGSGRVRSGRVGSGREVFKTSRVRLWSDPTRSDPRVLIRSVNSSDKFFPYPPPPKNKLAH